MMSEQLPLYKDPIWKDKETRSIICRKLTGIGEYAITHISAGPPNADGRTNSDYEAIMELFGEEELDRLTAEHEVRRIEQKRVDGERNEAKKVRQKQEILFNMKLEAFEVEEIKNSQNRDLKKRLRKAKSPIEVNAYATLLIQEALQNAE